LLESTHIALEASITIIKVFISVLCLARMSSEENVASLFRPRVNFQRAPHQPLPSREGAGEFGGPTSASLPGARLYI
jgi:hypothetical protein